jgi:SH3 domain-containing YSC84-like protein 1
MKLTNQTACTAKSSFPRRREPSLDKSVSSFQRKRESSLEKLKVRQRFLLSVALIFLTTSFCSPVHAQYVAMQNPSDVTVIEATNGFNQAMATQDSRIPPSILATAQGIAIIPNTLRGAFVVGLQHGRGVLVTRDARGQWQAPRFIEIAGGSFGYQIGVQSTDLILVFRSPRSIANLMRGTVKVGVDASAAAGPYGRQAAAGTDIGLSAEILSYSLSRGAFVGVSIDGSSISLDPRAEAIYYQTPGAFPASAMQLLQSINAYAAVPVAAAPGQAAPAGGWVAAGSRGGGDAEATRQQLAAASNQLAASLDENWKRYLVLPREVYTPNQVPNPQDTQQALQRYEDVARRPEYAALQAKPEFQQVLTSLRQLNSVRTASNNSLALPPPPK